MTRVPHLALRSAGLAASLLLTAGALTACGGSDDSSADDSTSGDTPSASASINNGEPGSDDTEAPSGDGSSSEFCTAYGEIVAAGGDDLAAAKDAIDKLSSVGVPDDMPDDAVAGYELIVDSINDAESEEELTELGNAFTEKDTTDLLAFTSYVSETCADALGLPSADAS
ncbi:MAG: hypothetical protein F2667_10340 [Actinobacteria bacterium]|uniref:Unannotated protein n=1 Tax=freshwater metagenome TaxID=449393 RepID=A0A6J6RAU6_9ZZZZ|nr:hypothetical protein [Actinomycetota bacterium]